MWHCNYLCTLKYLLVGGGAPPKMLPIRVGLLACPSASTITRKVANNISRIFWKVYALEQGTVD